MRVINADDLKARMYHEVFEKDSEDQRWDSGCWIRYKLFEKVVEECPNIESGIIRCKDCKHASHWYRDKFRCLLWHVDGIDVFADGFCNYAEMRVKDERFN